MDAHREGHLQKYCSLVGCNDTGIVSSLSKPALIFQFMLRQVFRCTKISSFVSIKSLVLRMKIPYSNFGKVVSDIVSTTSNSGNIGMAADEKF